VSSTPPPTARRSWRPTTPSWSTSTSAPRRRRGDWRGSCARPRDSRSQTTYPLPQDEAARLAALDADDLDADELRADVERLTSLAARHYGVSTASINIIGETEQEFLVCHGADWTPTDREDAICTYAIVDDRPVTVIEDVDEDPRFAGNETLEAMGTRSYVGADLTTPAGRTIGTVCVYHDEPRSFDDDRAYLRTLADLAIRLVTRGNDAAEGMSMVSTNRHCEKLLGDCDRLCPDLDRSRFGLIDCLSDPYGAKDLPVRMGTVSNPSDLTGIGIEFSGLYESLYQEAADRIRAGLYSISTLLMYSELQTVSRFVHSLGGRIAVTDGLGVFLTNSTTQDERVVDTITQLCDGRIDVREAEGTSELRVRGLGDQPETWTEL
jgi:GAF domain-containing protein